MKWVVVSVFDAKLAAYARPFVAPTLGAAIRSFGDEVLNKDSPLNQHPEDYQLYQLGTFFDDTGVVECPSPPFQVSKALDFIKQG